MLPNDFFYEKGFRALHEVGGAAVQQLCRRAAACFVCGSRWVPRAGAAGALGSCRGEDLLDLLEALLVAFVTVACSVSTRWVSTACSVSTRWVSTAEELLLGLLSIAATGGGGGGSTILFTVAS